MTKVRLEMRNRGRQDGGTGVSFELAFVLLARAI